ncbi:MAG: hypothetical protein QW774_01785 [Candidatus Micrarchaeaceae archaeon]
MPKPMHRSNSFRRLDRVTLKKRHVIHYERRRNSIPHCAICGVELNGISVSRHAKGRSLRTNERLFGGVLCAKCTAEVVKLSSRVESGELKLTDIGIKQRSYILQMISH